MMLILNFLRVLSNETRFSLLETDIKALMVSAWVAKNRETLRIDLWTKDMPVNEMFIFYHQSLLSMAQTLEKSTGHERLSGALRDYCDFFAEHALNASVAKRIKNMFLKFLLNFIVSPKLLLAIFQIILHYSSVNYTINTSL